ncbi:unnamed protein product, partial [Mycena citricolor]
LRSRDFCSSSEERTRMSPPSNHTKFQELLPRTTHHPPCSRTYGEINIPEPNSHVGEGHTRREGRSADSTDRHAQSLSGLSPRVGLPDHELSHGLTLSVGACKASQFQHCSGGSGPQHGR